MKIVNGKKYYTKDEFFNFLDNVVANAQHDLKKELKDLKKDYANVGSSI